MSQSVPDTMNRLCQAAQAGDTYELYNAILEEKDVLSHIDEAKLVDTPLHIAASRGHADFAKAMMYLMPSFGRKLNGNMYSPMQLALQNGYRDVALDLLAVDKDLVRVKGREGYTALHYAAENGDIDILAQFLKYCPTCVEDVTIRNETALHLAVKNNKLEAVEILARFLRRTHLYCKVSKSHLLNSKDRNGNTALHIAASNTQPQMIKVLMECRVDTKEINNQRSTASDLLEMESSQTNDREICLKNIQEVRTEICFPLRHLPILNERIKDIKFHYINAFSKLQKRKVEPALSERLRSKITAVEELIKIGNIINMSTEKINALLVVVILVLTATYQSMLSPPGGVYQGDYPASNRVGESVTTSSFFTIFFGLNFEVFLFASLLTAALINAVTKSGIVIVLFEILLSSLMWSVVDGLWVITPKPPDAAYVKPESPGAQISTFFCVFPLFLALDFSEGSICL